MYMGKLDLDSVGHYSRPDSKFYLSLLCHPSNLNRSCLGSFPCQVGRIDPETSREWFCIQDPAKFILHLDVLFLAQYSTSNEARMQTLQEHLDFLGHHSTNLALFLI
jgi:hypothetical protein